MNIVRIVKTQYGIEPIGALNRLKKVLNCEPIVCYNRLTRYLFNQTNHLTAIHIRSDAAMTPTILQILPAFNAGGVERVTFETVTGLAPIFGVHHIASAGGRYVADLPPTITHHSLPLNTKNPFTILANAKRIYNLIRQEKIDLVHARSRAPAWSAMLACRMAKIPFITTYHGTYNDNVIGKNTYNSVMVRSDHVIAISHFIESHIKEKYPHLTPNMTCVPEGIDTIVHDPAMLTEERLNKTRVHVGLPIDATQNRPYILLLPGRLTRWKGQATFLKALRTLNMPNWHAVILGDPQGRDAYANELRHLAQGLPVTFVTNTNDMPAAYAIADIVLSCSTDPEAFGRVTAEALAMERPIIGTAHGGTIELTANGTYGTVVPPGDIDALKQAILHTYHMPDEQRIQQGRLARAHIQKHYSLVEMLRLTQMVYEAALTKAYNI